MSNWTLKFFFIFGNFHDYNLLKIKWKYVMRKWNIIYNMIWCIYCICYKVSCQSIKNILEWWILYTSLLHKSYELIFFLIFINSDISFFNLKFRIYWHNYWFCRDFCCQLNVNPFHQQSACLCNSLRIIGLINIFKQI